LSTFKNYLKNFSVIKLFKLGLYVIIIYKINKKLKNNFVYIISCFLAINKYKKAQNLFDQYKKKYTFNFNDLLKILQFSDFFIFKNINYFTIPYYIKLVLINKFSSLNKNKKDLQKIKKYKNFYFNPDIYLIKSNLLAKTSENKVFFLNKYFVRFKLFKITIKNMKKNLCINNLINRKFKLSFYKPLVSIIVTTFNSKRFIENCLYSLINQTYSNIEIIVIDDASSDDTVHIVRKLMKKDKRIKYYKLKYNVGTYAAKNIAINYANGEFVTCHDSDDFAHPEKIEKQVRPLIRYPWLVFTVSYWIRLTDKGIFYARQTYPLLRLNPNSVMFRKDIVINKVGLWDYVKIGADSEFYYRLKIAFGRFRMFKIKKPLTIGSYRKNSLTANKSFGFKSGAIPKVRYDYWESWMKWHLAHKAKGSIPKISSNCYKRNFLATKKILVNTTNVTKNLNLKFKNI
jgi:glycosyltransferase involved in cell wall biosynthesis